MSQSTFRIDPNLSVTCAADMLFPRHAALTGLLQDRFIFAIGGSAKRQELPYL